MSERGQFRGGRGGQRGDRGGRGGGGERGGRGGGHAQGGDRKKENILDLTKYMDKELTVKFNGGREVTGKLKGYDQLMNLVLDEVKEVTRDEEGHTSTRSLGLLVARGTLLVLISPVDGSEEIENPFVQADDETETADLSRDLALLERDECDEYSKCPEQCKTVRICALAIT